MWGDEVKGVVEHRLACYDRVWELVQLAESEDQAQVSVAALRVALTRLS